MVPSIVSFYHFFSGPVFLTMTMPTKKETRVAYIGFLDHFFSDQTMFAWILDNEGAESKSYGCLYRFFSIHYFSRTKLCLPVFLKMMMPTKKIIMLRCIVNDEDADPKRSYGCLYRGHLAICKVHTTQWLGQSCLEGSW